MKKLILRAARLFFIRKQPVVSANIRRILVIKLCCIGDILFTTPLLRALAANYPQAQITYMVGTWCRELAAADPRVSNTITFDAYDRVGWLEKIRRIGKVIRDIRQGQFDIAFVLHRTPLAGCLAAAGGVPVRIGFDWEGNGFSLTIPVPFRPNAHEVDRHLDCLKALGAAPEGNWLELTPPPEAQDVADEFLKHHRWSSAAGSLIALFPGGGVNPGTVMTTKRWSVAGYREVCRQLTYHLNARIILVGSSQDKEIGDELLEDERFEPPVIRAEGKTTLLVLAALLKQCSLFIGGDSGPLHVAAAVGTATVSIFGPTDPALLAPRGRRHRVVDRHLACAPCFTPVTVRQGDDAGCRLGTVQCMREITAEEVLKAAEELLPDISGKKI
jgi:lipopolysaccharide heptosyltransferase II